MGAEPSKADPDKKSDTSRHKRRQGTNVVTHEELSELADKYLANKNTPTSEMENASSLLPPNLITAEQWAILESIKSLSEAAKVPSNPTPVHVNVTLNQPPNTAISNESTQEQQIQEYQAFMSYMKEKYGITNISQFQNVPHQHHFGRRPLVPNIVPHKKPAEDDHLKDLLDFVGSPVVPEETPRNVAAHTGAIPRTRGPHQNRGRYHDRGGRGGSSTHQDHEKSLEGKPHYYEKSFDGKPHHYEKSRGNHQNRGNFRGKFTGNRSEMKKFGSNETIPSLFDNPTTPNQRFQGHTRGGFRNRGGGHLNRAISHEKLFQGSDKLSIPKNTGAKDYMNSFGSSEKPNNVNLVDDKKFKAKIYRNNNLTKDDNINQKGTDKKQNEEPQKDEAGEASKKGGKKKNKNPGEQKKNEVPNTEKVKDEYFKIMLKKLKDVNDETESSSGALSEDEIKKMMLEFNKYLETKVEETLFPEKDDVEKEKNEAKKGKNKHAKQKKFDSNILETKIVPTEELKQLLPSHWAIINYPIIKSHLRVDLDPTSPEYTQIVALFQRSAKDMLKIENITRIENAYLWIMYSLKKEELTKLFGYEPEEKLLFHGTDKRNLFPIFEDNFNWRKLNKPRHKFGQGISFTPLASNASCHSRSHGNTPKSVILSRVWICHDRIGNEDTIFPPAGFDTTKRPDGKIVVKFDDSTFYPQYDISFTGQMEQQSPFKKVNVASPPAAT